MNILEEIIAYKKQEVKDRKELFPIKLLEQSLFFSSQPVSLRKYLQRPDKIGVIAEIKRKSPSKGSINPHVNIEATSIGYMQAGASGLSVLTDQKYFGGKNDDLTVARKFNFCPILRKDFIVDEYQIIEAKSIGADVILLIAAALDTDEISQFSALAHSLGMEVLLEVHDERELQQSLVGSVDMVGVNNRDLKTFTTDIQTSKDLASKIPSEFVKVTESGINDPEAVRDLMNYGFEGFLIGEYFMQFGEPHRACRTFIRALKTRQQKEEINP